MTRNDGEFLRSDRKIKIAGIMTMPVRKGNYKEQNFREATKLVRQAAKEGIQLACTFEQFLDGYGFDANKIPDLNDVNVDRCEIIEESKYVKGLADLAGELEIVIVAGIAIRQDKGTYNSALVFSSKGELVGKYYKTHNANKYARWFAPLSVEQKKARCPSFDLGTGRISVKICNDRHFGETTKYMVENGCELLMCPSFGKYDPSRLLDDTKALGIWAVFVHPDGCQFIKDGEIVFEKRVGGIALYEVEFREPKIA